jgi:hypothetical protein
LRIEIERQKYGICAAAFPILFEKNFHIAIGRLAMQSRKGCGAKGARDLARFNARTTNQGPFGALVAVQL